MADDTLKMMMPMMMMVVMAGVIQGILPQQAQAAQPQFECPIDGQLFWTYDELYQHFVTEHPAEPIEIIWE